MTKETINYSCLLDKSTNCKLTLYLYSNVRNAPELRKKLIEGELKCCIIKPNLICDPLQVAVAANKAAVSNLNNTMTTKSIFTEILFNLSISKNISQSLLKYGIDDNEKDIIVAVVNYVNEDDYTDDILKQIDGDLQPLSILALFRDEALIKKSYKIQDAELKVSSLVNSVISRIATKDFISH